MTLLGFAVATVVLGVICFRFGLRGLTVNRTHGGGQDAQHVTVLVIGVALVGYGIAAGVYLALR